VATLGGAYLVFKNTDRELDIRMVNVALTILSAKDKGTDTIQARRYALRALRRYGGVEIPDAEFDEWAKSGTVPTGTFPGAFWRESNAAAIEKFKSLGITVMPYEPPAGDAPTESPIENLPVKPDSPTIQDMQK
jgi:hypothetical protein